VLPPRGPGHAQPQNFVPPVARATLNPKTSSRPVARATLNPKTSSRPVARATLNPKTSSRPVARATLNPKTSSRPVARATLNPKTSSRPVARATLNPKTSSRPVARATANPQNLVPPRGPGRGQLGRRSSITSTNTQGQICGVGLERIATDLEVLSQQTRTLANAGLVGGIDVDEERATKPRSKEASPRPPWRRTARRWDTSPTRRAQPSPRRRSPAPASPPRRP